MENILLYSIDNIRPAPYIDGPSASRSGPSGALGALAAPCCQLHLSGWGPAKRGGGALFMIYCISAGGPALAGGRAPIKYSCNLRHR